MYKIFINQQFVIFSSQNPKLSYCKIINNSREKDVKKIVKSIKTGLFKENLCFLSKDYKNLYKIFKKNFEFIRAAGGVVFNKRESFLAIYKLGRWDLPKGKIDKSEKKIACAKREITEECGVNSLDVMRKLPSTYHIFLGSENRWKLKKTHWYKMKSDKKEKLVPLATERIEQCEWFEKERLTEFLNNTYPSMNDLMFNALF